MGRQPTRLATRNLHRLESMIELGYERLQRVYLTLAPSASANVLPGDPMLMCAVNHAVIRSSQPPSRRELTQVSAGHGLKPLQMCKMATNASTWDHARLNLISGVHAPHAAIPAGRHLV